MAFLAEIAKVIAQAKQTQGLEALSGKLETAMNRLGETAMYIGKTAMSPDFKVAFSYATPFLDVMGDVITAWMLLWRAAVAQPALEKLVGDAQGEERRALIEKNKNAAFYAGQIKSAEYFIEAVLPVTLGRMDAIQVGSKAVVDILEPSFGA